MSETLPPVLARELDRWARELGADGGGLLMIAVGVSERRRLAVESGLRAALEGWQVEGISVEGACVDPWAPVLASVSEGSARTLVSLAGVSDCDDPDGTLAALNLGREHLRRGSMSLVLWAGGLEDLDRLRRKAPDLWSYRRRVGFFLAAEDFDIASPEIDERDMLTAQIEQLQARLDTVELDDPLRVHLLLQFVDRLLDFGDRSSAATALEKADALVGEDASEVEHPELIRSRAWSAYQFERIGEMLMWTERIDWATTDSEAAHDAALHAEGGYRQRAKFGDAKRAREAVRRIKELFTQQRDAAAATNEAKMWLLLGDLPRARQLCEEATKALVDHRAYGASFIAKHRAKIARERLDSHVALIALHESWTLRSGLAASGQSAEAASQVVAAYRALGLFDDAERLCRQALAQNIPGFEQTVSLTSELVQTQACLDLRAARETHRAILQQLDQRITTCPAWERAMLRRARVKLLRLSVELEPDHADDLRRACIDTLDLAIYNAIEQRQFDLAQWARRQQAELTRDLHSFNRSLALSSTALEWATEHEGPSRVTECHIELAKTHRAAHQLDPATEQLDAAEQTLAAEDPLYQPRETWKLLLIERHHLALAREGPDAALVHLEHALTRMRAAGLRKLELELLHLVAELPNHPSTNTRRDQAAREALELARDAYLIFEEARALANLAIIEHSKAPELARRRLDDARELAPSCVFEPAHKRMRVAERQLAPA